MYLKKIFLVMLGLLLLTLPVLAENNEMVAKVGDQNITETQLNQVANTQQLLMQIAQVDQNLAQVLNDTDSGKKLLDEYRKLKLDELINEMVLKIEAEKRGINLTQSEKEEMFNNHIQQIKEQNGLTDEQLLNALKQQGIESLKQYQELFLANSNLTVNKLVEEEIINKISVSDAEAEEVYNINQDQFDASFAEVKEEIKTNIIQQKLQMALKNLIDNAKESIEIEKYL
jgi:dGTP triphosphohydrolase